MRLVDRPLDRCELFREHLHRDRVVVLPSDEEVAFRICENCLLSADEQRTPSTVAYT
jgi:hypothetical protein